MRPARTVVHNIVAFLRGFLARDRYLTEALAAVVTFGTGVLASLTLDAVQQRTSLAGFREMPMPECWMMLFAAPGLWSAVKLWREGEHVEGPVSLAVVLSFYLLGTFSLSVDLSNWGFWTLFALQLGVMKGYALVREWTYLRWAMSMLGFFFWFNLTISIAEHSPDGWPLLLSPCAGFAAANLLSVSRLSAKRVRHG